MKSDVGEDGALNILNEDFLLNLRLHDEKIQEASQFIYALLRDMSLYEFFYGLLGLFMAFYALLKIQQRKFEHPENYIFTILLALISSFDQVHLIVLSNRISFD